jgi:ribosomal protein S1
MAAHQPFPQLAEHFGDYLAPTRAAEWIALRDRLAAGMVFSGLIVCRTHFGVFLDTGHRFPGVLLATRLSPAPNSPDDLPAVGQKITASVLRLSDSDRQIVLVQP